MLMDEQIKQIACEYGRADEGTRGATWFGKKFGVSKQRIYGIVATLRKYGVQIPQPRYRRYHRIALELEEEHPELFEGGDN